MGLSSLRPWDLDVDPLGRQPLHPFQDESTLIQKTSSIFRQVDPELGEYFDTMVREDLLDLMNRKNKGPGAYCDTFPLARKPFIFHNAVGIHDDVQTMLHESGHAFHVFEAGKLPYAEQLNYPMEIAEVASMSMELLAAPYLKAEKGGYYNDADYARARIEHLESNILFWPYMAVVDGFQHWVYEHPAQAKDPRNCDAAWSDLWERFMQGVDWCGLEDDQSDRLAAQDAHLRGALLLYRVRPGADGRRHDLAQRPAGPGWRGKGLSPRALAGQQPALPELYQAAGARLAFDAGTLGELIALCEGADRRIRRMPKNALKALRGWGKMNSTIVISSPEVELTEPFCIAIPMAGHGTRMRPHTWSKAKPLIHLAGKTVLDYALAQFDTLPGDGNRPLGLHLQPVPAGPGEGVHGKGPPREKGGICGPGGHARAIRRALPGARIPAGTHADVLFGYADRDRSLLPAHRAGGWDRLGEGSARSAPFWRGGGGSNRAA